MPDLRAACLSRRTCVRCPLGSRFGLVLLVLSAIGVNSPGDKRYGQFLLFESFVLARRRQAPVQVLGSHHCLIVRTWG